MLSSTYSRWMGIDSWAGQPLYSLSPRVEEGMALTGILENNVMAAQAAASVPASTTPFLGFAFNYYQTPLTLPQVETFTVPANSPYTVVSSAVPLNPTTGVLIKDASGNVIAYNASVGAGQYSVSGNTFTFNAAQAGLVVTLTYNYAPTVAQSQQFVGDGFLGGTTPSDVTGTIGLIRRGLIYTTNFNAAFDFSALSTILKVGAGGIVDPAASGPVIPGYVYELPSAENPYLGIVFSAA